jgi:DNA repair protein RecN (Recombination protein N)
MLALKAGLPKRMSMPTIVFDEIDTGISGEVADKVGDIVYAMSKEMQVIIITHLPQIACKGQSHYLAYKESDNETTWSSLRMLDQEERIVEIAKMLSGEELSMAAVNNAKDLLSIK